MTRLFLDTEFNGFGGELISLALVPEQGGPLFYLVRWVPDEPDPFVKEHVLPKLVQAPMGDAAFNVALMDYLKEFNNAEIVADWPADLEHLCNQLTWNGRASGWRVNLLFTMVLVNTPPLSPSNPHNALSDAIALRDWYVTQGNNTCV